MYINFHKYNYDLVSENKDEYIERDKKAYKEILIKWFNENIENFIDRKWEIEEIQYLKQIGDFVKLLKEGESLYELGFYTSCIALIGICAEDFSKYLSIKEQKNNHITKTTKKGKTIDISQSSRLQSQLDENMISQENFNLLDVIRLIRNDCLHYNDNFKQKPINKISKEALKVLNNLKFVIKDLIGTDLKTEDINLLLNDTFNNANSRNLEETIWKHRNIFSHLLKINIAQNPNIKIVNKYNVYEITNLDEDEIELTEIIEDRVKKFRLYVWVDIDDKGRNLIDKEGLSIGDIVSAKLYSNVDINGQTSIWYLDEIKKI